MIWSDDLKKLKSVKLNLKESLEEFKDIENESAEKEFAEHNIKKAIKWIERLENGYGSSNNIPIG